MSSHNHGPQFMKKRFRFEYSGDNDQQYRDNWDRIFGKKSWQDSINEAVPVGEPNPETVEAVEAAAVFVTPYSVPVIHRCTDPTCYCNTSPGTQLELPFPKES